MRVTKTDGWKWDADDVLPVWTADSDEISLDVRRQGRRRFSWSASSNYRLESGIDQMTGTATSLRLAKNMAALAALCLGDDPGDWR